MSFEGFYECLCENGHYHQVNTSHEWFYFYEGTSPFICNFCKAKCAFTHLCDVTNGFGKDYPQSLPASKEEIGFDDEPAQDHHGNKYFIKHSKYQPVNMMKPDEANSDLSGDCWIIQEP